MLKLKRAALAACLLLTLAAASLAQGGPEPRRAARRDGQTPSERRDVGALVKKLGGRDAAAAGEAAEELAEVGEEAAHALTEALKSPETQTRLYAALALSAVDPKRADAVEVLRAIVRDRREHYLVRRHAAFALARTAAGVRALAALLRDEDDEVRLSSAFAFEELSEADSDDPEGPHAELRRARPAIVEALRVERHPVVRGVLDETLGQIGPASNSVRVPRGEG